MRSLHQEEETSLQSKWSDFEKEIQSLRSIADQIETYTRSDKPREHEEMTRKVSEILARVEAKKEEAQQLEPKLHAIRRAVEDQERHKNQLKQNIEILEATAGLRALRKDVEELEKKRAAITGHRTAHKEFEALKAEKEKVYQKKAMADGRFSSHMEQIRALQVCCG